MPRTYACTGCRRPIEVPVGAVCPQCPECRAAWTKVRLSREDRTPTARIVIPLELLRAAG